MSDSLSRQSGLFVAYAAVVPVESQHEGEFSTAGLSSLAQRGWASDGLHGRCNGGRNRSRWASRRLLGYLPSGTGSITLANGAVIEVVRVDAPAHVRQRRSVRRSACTAVPAGCREARRI